MGASAASDALLGTAVDAATDSELTDALRVVFLVLAVMAVLAAAFTAWAMRSQESAAERG